MCKFSCLLLNVKTRPEMDQETVHFKFKTFPDHLASTFQDLVEKEHFADVTLVSDDQIQTPAHKIVLSACSPVLKNLLINNPHSHPLFYLRGVKQQELHSILQFMYLGEATIYQNRLNEFMDITRDLELKEFIEDEVPSEDVKQEPFIKGHYIDDKNTTSASNSIEDILNYDTPEQIYNFSDGEVKDTGSFRCQECESSFKYKRGLQSHFKAHQGVKYACKECNYKATRSDSLKAHTESQHCVITHSCNLCDYKATGKPNLIRHQQSIHKGILYDCNQCEYRAGRLDNLKKHKQSKHDGVRYYCDKCDKNFTEKVNLSKHEQTKHEDNTNLHLCNLCDNQFSDNGTLHEHLTSTHGIATYSCNQCVFHAERQNTLWKHKQRKH